MKKILDARNRLQTHDGWVLVHKKTKAVLEETFSTTRSETRDLLRDINKQVPDDLFKPPNQYRISKARLRVEVIPDGKA